MPKDTIRVFIAVELPGEIQKALGGLIEKLKDPKDKISWVKPHNIHFTMKFLGNVPLGDIDSIKDVVSKTAENCQVFDVTVKGTGVFPREKAPRIVWTGITEGQDGMSKIFDDLETGLSQIGFPKEERSFKPHLTLGRVKFVKDIDAFIKTLNDYKENILGKIAINSISLIKSTLTPKGSIYETLFTAKMK